MKILILIKCFFLSIATIFKEDRQRQKALNEFKYLRSETDEEMKQRYNDITVAAQKLGAQ